MVDEISVIRRPQKTKQTDASIGGGSVENNASRAEKATAPSPSVEVELSEGTALKNAPNSTRPRSEN